MHEDAAHNKIKGKCEEQLTREHVDAQANEQSLLQYHGERSRLVPEVGRLIWLNWIRL